MKKQGKAANRISANPIDVPITAKRAAYFWTRTRAISNGCVDWTAGKNNAGYGIFKIGYRMWLAHRVAFELKVRKLKPYELVLHHCDRRSCVNVDHLFVGNNEDNVRDRVAKGRSGAAYGADCARCRMPWEVVLQIRAEYAANPQPFEVMGRKFKTTGSNVAKIVRNQSRLRA